MLSARGWVARALVVGTVGALAICRAAPSCDAMNWYDLDQYAAAQSLLDTGTMTGADGTPYVLWPPLYPVAVAMLAWTGLSVPHAALLLNALLFVALCAAFSSWMEATGASSRLRLLGSVGLVTPTLVSAGSRPRSEMLFLCLVVISLASLQRFIRGGNTRDLHITLLATACAVSTRYVGVLLVATVAASLVRHAVGPVAKARAALTAALCVVPLAAWAVRNEVIAGTLGGQRGRPVLGLPWVTENVGTAAVSVFNWVFPITLVPRGVCVAFLFVVLVWFARSQRVASDVEGDVRAVPAVFATFYFVGYFMIASVVQIGLMDDRMVLPLLPAALWMHIVAIDALARSRSPRGCIAIEMAGFAFVPLALIRIARMSLHGGS